LLSLLFTTKHLNASSDAYSVEMITDYVTAERVKIQFPYLDAKHFIELDGIGPQVISELLMGEPRPFSELSEVDVQNLRDQFQAKVPNPFAYWLKMKAETTRLEVDSVATDHGLLEQLLDSNT